MIYKYNKGNCFKGKTQRYGNTFIRVKGTYLFPQMVNMPWYTIELVSDNVTCETMRIQEKELDKFECCDVNYFTNALAAYNTYKSRLSELNKPIK